MQHSTGSGLQEQQQHRGKKADTVAQFYSELVQLPIETAGMVNISDRSVTQQHATEPPATWLQDAHHLSLHHQQQQQPLAMHAPRLNFSAGNERSYATASALDAPVQMPFAPVRFSDRTHFLDPNVDTLTLPAKASGANYQQRNAESVPDHTLPQQCGLQQQQQEQRHQQPMHPAAPTHTASTRRPIDRGNLGYQLLTKAGWQEGQGLGANEQGIAAPLTVTYNKGNLGLGFSKQQQQHSTAAAGAGGGTCPIQAAEGAAGGAAAGPVLGGKRVAALVAAELGAEDLDAKVKRHRQVQQTKAKQQREKAIQSHLYREFNDVEGPDSNPLLAKSHRLTATNPLLD